MKLFRLRNFTLLLLLSLPSICPADQEVIGPWGSLNNTDNSFIIPANQAQDLLNVELSDTTKSIKKRKGYGVAFTLSNATSPVHGIYDFYDSNGATVDLYFNDRNMNVSVSGGSPTVFFSTGPNGATYQCVDSAGFAYCANTQRTNIIKVNSSTYTMLSGFTSTGTMLALTPERLVQSGFSGDPNAILFSAANDFSNWTLGGNPTSPITFTITSPGSSVKHITYAHGRIYYFKDSSFGYILEGATLADWKVVSISNFLGNLFNTSIYRDEILYFQGNDGHFYAYDGSNLVKLSKDIQQTISQTQGRTSNSWTQSSQADFSSGSTNPQGFISSSIVAGQLMGSSFTVTETSSITFQQGTMVNVETSTNNYVFISTFNRNYKDTADAFSFENSGNFSSHWAVMSGTMGVIPQASGSSGFNTCTPVTAKDGTNYLISSLSISSSPPGGATAIQASIVDSSDDSELGTTYFSYADADCTWTQRTILVSSLANMVRRNVYLKFRFQDTMSSPLRSNSFIASGNNITFWTITDKATAGGKVRYFGVDFIEGGYSVSTGTYTSQSYDTGISTNLVSVSSIGVTVNQYVPQITLQGSHNNSTWQDLGSNLVSTNTVVGRRYLRYISSFTVTGSSDALSTLDNVTLVARATGTYLSSVHNSPALTNWDSLGVNYQANEGSINFFVRGSTGVFYASATAIPAWSPISAGAIPSISTSVYFQLASSFSITAATQNPTLDSFTFNWFEGSASDKTYAIYHDNANWWSVASGTGATTNNKILRFDLVNPGWYIYDIGTGGMLVRSQSLYFGSVLAGKIYKYGDTDSDDGVAINSYWKSKDFSGTSPFLDKDYTRLSAAFKTVSNSTATITYTIDGSSETSYSVNLGSSTSLFMQKNVNLPLGKTGKTVSFRIGNNQVDGPWEIFGAMFDYVTKPWVPK